MRLDKEIIEKIFDYRRRFRWWREKHDLTRRGITQGIRNIKMWFPVVWHDRWWDHSFFYTILRFKLSLMEKGFRKWGHSTCSKKDAKKIKTCVLLLDRLIKDDYITYNGGDNIRKSFEEEQRMAEHDLELLFEILRKNIRSWWD
jgi:hypothetical protein